MKKITKSLLLGTAAGLVAVAGAQAADMPVKAAPVQYVKICSLYGDGFYYIPGTDTCLKMGGYLRVQGEYKWATAASHWARATWPQGAKRGTSPTTSTIASAARSPGTCASRPNTARCAPTSASGRRTPPRRSRRRHHLQPVLGSRLHPVCGLHRGPVAVVLRPGHLRRRLQLSQRARLRRHRRRGPEPLGLHRPVRQRLLGLSLARRPDPFRNNANGALDVTAANFFNLGASPPTTLQQPRCKRVSGFGFRVPDFAVNLRVDQAWGLVGISAVLHDVSGVTSPHPTRSTTAIRRQVRLGRGGRRQVQPAGRRCGRLQRLLRGRRYGSLHQPSLYQVYNNSNEIGLNWLSEGVFGNGTNVELTRAWSALAFYEHIWNPKWRTSWFGGYVNVNYSDGATNLINSSFAAGSACRPVPGNPGAGVGTINAFTPLAGNSCSPDYSYSRNRLADAVEPGAAARYRSRNCSTPRTPRRLRDRLQRRRHRARVRLAAPGLGPRRPKRLVRHVPLAA